ncbi:ArsR family transcriptional regulator [Aureimonas sp. Leaf454]|uniref:ArsR/SmtB family transcription factor n=1 Tax=Aureimonas sp. Leaf454 TaxID=1736381 RepID=UPI0006FB58C3|nr:helix-turn-helix transcriptional regulator [Aureimonas sp. Leaf454]KQT50779.1 ArsR family transcriptional regulator [Aureimonas sp. Leaf454]
MTKFFHPSADDIDLTAVLAALGDPLRLEIVRKLSESREGQNCSASAPFPDVARSTLTSHFRILREAGLVFTTKKGVENINVLRREDLEKRFPGLLKLILSCERPPA